MIAYLNISLMAICDPYDEEHAEAVAEHLAAIIRSQALDKSSGAYF
jgi:hypothetical protein